MPIGQPSYLVSVGELSGDLLAADVVSALRTLEPDWCPFGIAGPNLQTQKVIELDRIENLSVMGVFEVVKSLERLRLLEQRILASVMRQRPLFALLVDYPGFHFRLAESLRRMGVLVFQYVAPKVWAWGESRVARLRSDFDHVFGILPFEERFFANHHVPYTYVGSPHVERTAKVQVSKGDFGIGDNCKVFAFLPGSRLGEVTSMISVMRSCAEQLRKRFSDSLFIVPLAPTIQISEIVSGQAKNARVNFEHAFDGILTFVQGMSLEVMKISDAALVASGTATLECALLGTPMCVVYTMNELSYAIASRYVTVKYASLVNLLAGRQVVHEYIQNFDISKVADEISDLASQSAARERMLADFEGVREGLIGGANTTTARLIQEKVQHAKPRAF